jgi:putative CocE/NonD family hydrolase
MLGKSHRVLVRAFRSGHVRWLAVLRAIRADGVKFTAASRRRRGRVRDERLWRSAAVHGYCARLPRGDHCMRFWSLPALLASLATVSLHATPPLAPDIPKKFTAPHANFDYEKREVMIPMRDGVKLHTVIMLPKGAAHAPIMLTRTPYNASKRAERNVSPYLFASLPQGDEQFSSDGYIRVFQDVRGKYGSEGEYVMTRPLRGPLNDSKVDHSTDAWDTIDWLVKHVRESNGKVGMIGSSYEGFTVLMALVHPHPALKAAVPMSPMVDGWKGDDWFHNGAFRQTNLDYIHAQTTEKGEGKHFAREAYDDYTNFLRAGSTGAFAQAHGFEQLAFWKKLAEHPAYDAFWQEQALDVILAKQLPSVPTLIVASLWDQEDMYGALHTYAAIKPKDSGNNVFLALGPWRHSGVNYDGSVLGPLKLDGDTALQFRRDVMKPFLDAHLKDTAPAAATPAVFAYETGTNVWRKLPRWPLACESGCTGAMKPLYLAENFHAAFAPPVKEGSDSYVSDPAKPVPYQQRPVRFEDGEAWRRWLVSDQRLVDDRPDVLSYVSDALDKPLQISGTPVVNLFAATSGTDSDWVVKLIDVYPDVVPSQPEMGGYELGIGMEIFRGRYRESPEHPAPLTPDKVEKYRFELPAANHVFLPGHRVMVQIQSSWFPLYDRNPQTFVDNVFFAQPGDYRAATQRIHRGGAQATNVELPVLDD